MNAKVNSIRMLAIGGLSLMMMSKAGAVIPEKVKLTLLPNKMMVIETNMRPAQRAQLEIIDLATREIVYNNQLEVAEDHKALYNLQALPEGKYSLVIEHGNMTHEKDFLLADGNPYMIREVSYTAPIFKMSEEGKLQVHYLNNSGEKVVVAFFNEMEEIFSDEIAITTAFDRTYNLKNLERGKYSVVLKTGNKSFYYDLNKM